MINLLVINNDPVICKKIVNGVMMYVKNIRTCGISYTAKEAIEIIKKHKIDVVILNYDMPNEDARNFLKFLDKNNNDDKMSIILLTDKDDNNEFINNKYIYKILHKPNKLTPIVYTVREISGHNTTFRQSLLRDKIYKELEKLQYNFSYVGTQYMAEAIYELYSKNYIYTGGNLSRNVYPTIAENHNTTVNNIKCNITSATRSMTEKCPKEVMENYLFCDLDEKPKVKEIMYKIINRL